MSGKSSIKILFVAPTEMESNAIGADFVCGVGAVESASNLAHIILDYRPSMVILAGIAGNIDTTLKNGDVVSVSCERTADTGVFRADKFIPLFEKEYKCPDAHLASLPIVISQSVNAAGSPYTANLAQIENMEGAAFFAVAQASAVRFMEIRAISNRVGESREKWDIELALKQLAIEIQRLRDEFEH